MGKHSNDPYATDPSLTGSTPVAGSAPTMGSGVPLGENSETADIVQQARAREDGFLYGDDMVITNPPNWQHQDSKQLYHGATTNNDPGTAETASQDWIGHGGELEQIAGDLYSAITELGAAWVGRGAGSAQGALVGIANSSTQAGAAARTMGNRMSQQAAAAAEVKKMPPPKDFDPGQATKAMLAGGPAAMVADMKAQADEAKEIKAQQVAYFNAYTKSMSEIDSSTPSFGPESLGLKTVTGPAGPGAGSVGGVGASGVPAGSGPVGADSVNVNVAPTGHVAPVAAEQSVDAAGYAPAPPAAPAMGSAPVAGASAAPAPHAAPAPPSNAAAQFGGAAIGAGLGFAGGRLAAGGRTGASKEKAEDATTEASDTAASDVGASANQGASASSVAPQNPMVSSGGTVGGAGAHPPAGPMGAGMGAAGGQQGQEEEHTHASFLIEPDPDDAFGANEATPPPVIGAWFDDDEDGQ